MNHFPLWFPNALGSELFPQSHSPKRVSGSSQIYWLCEGSFSHSSIGTQLKRQVKRLFLKTCLWTGTVILNGKVNAPPWGPLLCGSQESPFSWQWAHRDWWERVRPRPATSFRLPTACLGCPGRCFQKRPLASWPPLPEAALELAQNPKVELFQVVI